MKLFSVPHSPYAARVRMQIAAAELPVVVCDPPGGLGSDQFKALTPTGKVPVLEVDGNYLVESIAIMEYLEERFPDKALLPSDPEQRAWIRSVSRYADLDLAQALFPLFLALRQKPADPGEIAKNIDALKQKLKILNAFLAQPVSADIATPGFLGCALAPTLFYVVTVPPLLGEADILSATSGLAAWWKTVSTSKPVAGVLEEMEAGLRGMLAA